MNTLPPGVCYPPARVDAVEDDYHGMRVRDPYRWLEDADAPDTRAWVDAENALTAALIGTPSRERLRASRKRPAAGRSKLPVTIRKGISFVCLRFLRVFVVSLLGSEAPL
jgi:Prolyl oligopeptidase, N-terminal beta-propeller domain